MTVHPLKYPQLEISAFYSRRSSTAIPAVSLSPVLPQNPLLHLQWNISASLTWHAAPFLQGFGWQGLFPHSPTPLPYKLSPPFSCRLSTRLLTSSMRIQPTRPVATAVCSLALKKKKRKRKIWLQPIRHALPQMWMASLVPGENQD